jgi:hypothetical protein
MSAEADDERPERRTGADIERGRFIHVPASSGIRSPLAGQISLGALGTRPMDAENRTTASVASARFVCYQPASARSNAHAGRRRHV